MKTQLIIAALALYSGIKFSNPKVEQANATTAVEISCQRMSPQTEVILIEQHAAPEWGLQVDQAWQEYHDGLIFIEELVPDRHYILKRTGLDIEVVMDMD